MDFKQIGKYLGAGIVAGGLAYFIVSKIQKIFGDPITVESTNSILLTSSDMMNPDLSVDEYIHLVKQIM